MRSIGLRRPWLAISSAIVTLLTAAATAVAIAVPAGAAGDLSLLVLPNQGESAIYSFASSATSSIDLTMYELKDTTLVNDLVAREKAGVNVRVILDRQHESYDSSAYSTLTKGGVSVVWSSSAFTYTHQKTLTVDNRESYITTGNLDITYYSTSRDYGVFDTDAADVAAVVATFNADFAHKSITPSDGDDLVWSPTDSQTRILSVINGAKSSLDIEQEEFSDSAVVSAIVAAEKKDVKVRVVVEDPSSYSSELKQVISAGGTVEGYSSSTGFYIHAKAIVADYGKSTAKVFAGSENFSSNSLNDNRELGLITTGPGMLSGIESAFTSDYDGGTRYTG
ncbi:MAG TPA: phospholipase D-like domain-containing protein [Streptosporangiaceae bacterium]